jgi:hypothetical protein
MAQYFCIGQCWLRPDDHASPRMVGVGEIIRYSGEPGSTLIPIDQEAAAAKAKARGSRDAFTRSIDDRNVRRMRARLSRGHAAQLEKLELTVSDGAKSIEAA